MGDRELHRWVSDKLHDVLGFSESSTAQYVVALARNSVKAGKGVSALLAQLENVDVPTTAVSRVFATELMSRWGIPASSTSSLAQHKTSQHPVTLLTSIVDEITVVKTHSNMARAYGSASPDPWQFL